ncbi:hypothetical protein HPB48_009082 [Haemaphysalis longicornis]|uniref:YqaJ viral recombinase domain-containing protein n=1 Tax=Haemaphysalis longicornis TaxID=44386 RepID=A0A9J6FYJ3_HAELO|nr:hypothetical protein HPB48_009082 [Haemaphysalis longicornis]
MAHSGQVREKKRIIGSICRELHTFEEKNKRTWAAKLDRLYCRSTFTGNEATTYGRDNEPIALEEYETVHQAKVGRLGLVVAPEVPWLGYSPDGVSSQANRHVLIEVKCPVLGKEDSIVNLVHKKGAISPCRGRKHCPQEAAQILFPGAAGPAPSRNGCVPLCGLLACGKPCA